MEGAQCHSKSPHLKSEPTVTWISCYALCYMWLSLSKPLHWFYCIRWWWHLSRRSRCCCFCSICGCSCGCFITHKTCTNLKVNKNNDIEIFSAEKWTASLLPHNHPVRWKQQFRIRFSRAKLWRQLRSKFYITERDRARALQTRQIIFQWTREKLNFIR